MYKIRRLLEKLGLLNVSIDAFFAVKCLPYPVGKIVKKQSEGVRLC